MAGDGGDEVDQSGEQPDRKPPPTPEQTVAISFVDMFTQDAITKTPPASQVLQDQGFDPPAGNAELEAARDVVVTPFVIESEQQPMAPAWKPARSCNASMCTWLYKSALGCQWWRAPHRHPAPSAAIRSTSYSPP